MNLIPKKPTSYPVPPFREITLMVFGAPGSGKTTFCSGDDNTLFIATEPGQDFTTAAVTPCYSWETFRAIIDEITKKRNLIRQGQLPLSECPYTSFVIDIVDNLASQCRDYVCKKKGLLYPPTNDFGKTWSEVTTEWKRKLTELLIMGNVRFISHCTTQTVEVSADNGLNIEVERQIPTFFGSKMAQYLDGIVNAVGYCSVNAKGEYNITFRQTASIAAKDRTGILSECSPLRLEWSIVNSAYSELAEKKGLQIKSKLGVKK